MRKRESNNGLLSWAVRKYKAPILCAKDRGFKGYEMSLRERVAYSALMRTIRFQTFSP